MARNRAAVVMQPDLSARRVSLLRSRSTVVLPQPLVGDVTANRGAIEKLSTAQLRSIHNAMASAAGCKASLLDVFLPLQSFLLPGRSRSAIFLELNFS